MPPNCCLCDKGLETGDTCELIRFFKTESDRQWHAVAASEGEVAGHPPDCDWFCNLHAAAVKNLRHHDRSTALLHLRENELWQLIYIDLFDRDTPPSVQRSGVGFESGFFEFWDQILATTEADGRRYPSDFRLALHGNHADYSLPRDCPELTIIKQHLPTDEGSVQAIGQLALGQAQQFRKSGLLGAAKYLTSRTQSLAPKQT